MTKLIRKANNPINMIAVFGLLVEAIAVASLSSSAINQDQLTFIVWFIIIFPLLLLTCFMFLVINHPGKLYSPMDYKNSQDFMDVIGLKIATSVIKINSDAISELAALDIELIPFWERINHRSSEDGMNKLKTLETWVKKLEQQVSKSQSEDKISNMSALREVYMKYLEQARLCYASGQQYQKVRERVISGLDSIRKK